MPNFRIDLHVHTRRYSPCAELLDPERLAGWLRSSSALAGLVLTEHDAMWGAEELRQTMGELDPTRRIYRGVEVSSADAHFVVIGLDQLGSIRAGITARELVARTADQGATVILAHPLRALPRGVAPPILENLPEGIQAVELPWDGGAEKIRAVARDRGWALVSGSDAHSLEVVGSSFTELPVLPEDERELAKALQDGLGVPGRMNPRSRTGRVR